jgi:hypothetical protein
MVNQQWPHDTSPRGGAREYHDSWAGPAGPNLNVTVNTIASDAPSGAPLIPNSPLKPIRFRFEVDDHDLFYPAAIMPGDRPTVAQTLPSALEWLWKGYPSQ